MNRRNILLTGIIVILLVMLGGFISYRNSFQSLTITSKIDFSLKLYQASDAHESNAAKNNTVILATSKQGKYQVKKGDYIYVVSGKSSDYKTFTQGVSVGANPAHIAVPALDYTDKKLVELLKAEEPTIKSVIQARYPSQMQLYTVQAGKLYENGQWYGAKLVPNNPATYDALRIVLKKDGSTWKLVTDPPDIIISKPVYPEIPNDILTDLNNFR